MRRRLLALAVLFACVAHSTCFAQAQPAPAFISDWKAFCSKSTADWRVSPALSKSALPDRIACLDGGDGKSLLRIRVETGDASERESGVKPSERVELQLRRELVKFDEPVWYHFRFRTLSPWITIDNRTVIHQIKQNIAAEHLKANGGKCDSANPLIKIEVRGEPGGGVFRLAKAGTVQCGDSVGQEVICGPWPVSLDAWHSVHVAIFVSQTDAASEVRVWLDGRPCPVFRGILGYPTFGKRGPDGRPIIDVQPRFGIYRDSIDVSQTIEFADIAFWSEMPFDHPQWAPITGEIHEPSKVRHGREPSP